MATAPSFRACHPLSQMVPKGDFLTKEIPVGSSMSIPAREKSDWILTTKLNPPLIRSDKELAEIGPLFGTKLPGLGPFDISGKFAGSTKIISLNSDFTGLAKMVHRPESPPNSSFKILIWAAFSRKDVPQQRAHPPWLAARNLQFSVSWFFILSFTHLLKSFPI